MPGKGAPSGTGGPPVPSGTSRVPRPGQGQARTPVPAGTSRVPRPGQGQARTPVPAGTSRPPSAPLRPPTPSISPRATKDVSAFTAQFKGQPLQVTAPTEIVIGGKKRGVLPGGG